MRSGTRFENSVKNSSIAFLGQITVIVLGFVIRSIFIYKLGQQYLGVNGVMESMLTLLSMTELGIGTSVAFALYKPISLDDKKHIGILMAFYRRTYHIIGILTFVAGILFIPFMNFFTKDAEGVSGIKIIYMFFLLNTVLSYFFAYKRTLLSAYQMNYINSLSEDVCCLIKYILQAVVLMVFESYIGYLIVNLVCVFLSNVVISYICDKHYGFINEYKKEKLSESDKALLKTSVVSLMYQKIGAKLVTGTDNLMISYVSIAVMGIYSNYSMVVSTITRVVHNVTQAVMGSVGNLLVSADEDNKYRVYCEIVFIEFCFYFIVSMGLSGVLERFISLWAGADWVLPKAVTFAVIMNFFLMGMRQPNVMVIEAAGLFNKMRLKAVGEVLVNLVVSFICLIIFKMGIYGVLFGTTVSMISVCIWWETIAVHKYSFKKSTMKYWIKYIKYVLIALFGCTINYFVCNSIMISGLLGVIASGIISLLFGGVIILLFFYKSEEFKSFLARILKRGGEIGNGEQL